MSVVDLVTLFEQEIRQLPRRPERDFLVHVLRGAHRGITVKQAVRELDLTPQYVAKRFRKLRLRHPQWYLSMARLVAAARTLEAANAQIAQVAGMLRFGDSADLHKMVRSYIGMPIKSLRAIGMLDYVVEEFRFGLIPGCRDVARRTTTSAPASSAPTTHDRLADLPVVSIEIGKGSNGIAGGSIDPLTNGP